MEIERRVHVYFSKVLECNLRITRRGEVVLFFFVFVVDP